MTKPDPARWVESSRGRYPVFVGSGVLDSVGEILLDIIGRRRLFCLVDETVRTIYGDRLREQLPQETIFLGVPVGETIKSLPTYQHLIEQLAVAGAHRDSVVVSVGGGVTGDLAGFVAASYMRGVDFVQIPTTLLAQADSSIGGKVGVNLDAGKNLAGAFHPPRLVVSDVDLLGSLPTNELRCGAFEALKSGVIGDHDLFAILEQLGDRVLDGDPEALEEVVRRSVEVKGAIVSEDEKEGGGRRLLNYGHTVGHGIERALNYEVLSHGEAIAWGMIAANSIAFERGLLAGPVRQRIDEAILNLSPSDLPKLSAGSVLEPTRLDKKFLAGRIVMVLPVEIGRCEVVADVSREELTRGVDQVLTMSS